MFFGTRFFRGRKEDKVGTNNLVSGFKKIIEDEENEILNDEDFSENDEIEKSKKSLLDTLEEMSKRGIYLEGWQIQPSNVGENIETGIFAYRCEAPWVDDGPGKDFINLNVGWSMDFTWPNLHDRPFIEWLEMDGWNHDGSIFVFGYNVKYCISEELLSMIEKSWKERKDSLDASFNNWFENYRKKIQMNRGGN